MALLGMKSESGLPEGAGRILFCGLFLAFVTAFFLLLVVRGMLATTILEGAIAGLLVWLGFVATHGASNILFERRPAMLFALTQAELAISFLVMGIILAVWR